MTGQLNREGYRIEKLVFQTLPGVWVPAHFYIPDLTQESRPAVLLLGAHAWGDGKAHPDAQTFAIVVPGAIMGGICARTEAAGRIVLGG